MEAIPDRQWVSRLMSERGMPGHIVRHCRAVRMVAVAIACALREKGFGIDVRLVDRASLLHDICKADCLGGGDHALMGRQLLDRLGFPRIGDVVGQHVRLRSMEVCEAMVVNYADKRVMHDRVVSLERRFVDLMDRYRRDEQRVKSRRTICTPARWSASWYGHRGSILSGSEPKSGIGRSPSRWWTWSLSSERRG